MSDSASDLVTGYVTNAITTSAGTGPGVLRVPPDEGHGWYKAPDIGPRRSAAPGTTQSEPGDHEGSGTVARC